MYIMPSLVLPGTITAKELQTRSSCGPQSTKPSELAEGITNFRTATGLQSDITTALNSMLWVTFSLRPLAREELFQSLHNLQSTASVAEIWHQVHLFLRGTCLFFFIWEDHIPLVVPV